MIAKPMPLPVADAGILSNLWRRLGCWLRALGGGQDGPAGRLPEDIYARLRHG